MTNFLMSGRSRVTSRSWWFFLFLITILLMLMPQTVTAQPRATDLNLWLHGSQNDFELDVRAGQENKLFLDVRNYGLEVINNISLSAEGPKGWTIRISPSTISALSAGNVTTVDVIINPSGDAVTNQQQVTFAVESDETPQQKISFFITVKPAQTWLWLWIIVGAVVVGVFIVIFLRFGRE